jgi:hypothetical protein
MSASTVTAAGGLLVSCAIVRRENVIHVEDVVVILVVRTVVVTRF